VRDLASYNATTGVTSVVNHRVYDSYGNLESSINPSTNQPAAVDCLFGFTGQAFDNATGLQNNVNRWYDAKVGRWASQDPIGFTAGDTNTYWYVGNSPTNATDPTGRLIYFWWTDTRVFIYCTWTDAARKKHTVEGEGPAFLHATLGNIKAAGGVINTLTLKGHGAIDGTGFPSTMTVTDGVVHTYGIIDKYGQVSGVDIAGLLRQLTNANSTINLSGCFTGPAASALATILNNGATVVGKHGPCFSIPLTSRSAGVWWSYRCLPPPPAKKNGS